MWPLPLVLAAEAAPGWQQFILPGALALLATVGAAWLALRGTFRTASVAHEAEFDKIVHARVVSLEAQVARLEATLETRTADRDRYRELNASLRVAFRAHGLDPDDPDDLRGPRGGHGR